eukprot:14654727-Alexandrium_andersonii.AAC.1
MSDKERRAHWRQIQEVATQLGDTSLVDQAKAKLDQLAPPPPQPPAVRTTFQIAAKRAEAAARKLELLQIDVQNLQNELDEKNE